jgi:ankyrin repeat protein
MLVLACLIPLLWPSPNQPLITAVQLRDYRRVHALVEEQLALIEADMRAPDAAAAARWNGRRKAQVDDIDFGSGRRIMHIAAQYGDVNIVKYVHKRGASIDVQKADDLRTPLHLAATFNEAPVVQQLLKYGADVNARAQYGWTPLLKAVLLSNHDTVSVLLSAGADPNAAVDDSFNAMQCALIYSDERMGLLLLRGGAYVEEGEKRFDEFEKLKETLLAAGLVSEEDIKQPSTFARTTTQQQSNDTKGDAASRQDGMEPWQMGDDE